MPNYQADSRASELRDRRDRSTRNLLRAAARVPDPAVRQSLLERAVLLNQAIALAVSQRYRRRGVDSEDLAQVAMLGLVKSVRSYCPGRDTPFTAYAVPTIKGEIRRYFRDRGWTVADPANPLERVENVLMLRPALKALGARERQILRLRFIDNLTQEQIGHRIGVSQMQVSRRLTAILAKLRRNIEDPRAA